jgi:aminomethyltransferase
VLEPGSDEAIGSVTSGTLSPSLGRAIAMAYVPPERSAPGTMLEVGIRSSRVPAQVVPLPFYTRQQATAGARGNAGPSRLARSEAKPSGGEA